MDLSPGQPAPPLVPLVPGKPALLFFFKTECPTCPLAAPSVQLLAHGFGAAVTSVGISQDAPEASRPFLTDLGIDLPVRFDHEDFAVSRAYGLQTVPTTVLVSGEGTVHAIVEGWSRQAYEALSADLARLTGLPAAPVTFPGDTRPSFRPG